MSNWMRRRIERSRARCEKAATNDKSDRDQGENEKQRLAGPPSPGGKGEGASPQRH